MNLGPYRNLEEVGRGGMGVVYRAYDQRERRTVAIKAIHRSAATDQKARLALIREAGATARLVHPNIVRVLEVGQQKALLYIVMEYLEGEALNRILRTGKALSLSSRLDVIRQVCVALHHAHENGVVHRDIKPANVFILTDHSVKVLDFGISSFARLREWSEGEGLVGTPLYMSPEQVTLSDVGPASDIWSVGVTLFELVHCQMPFAGRTFDVLRNQILSAEILPTPASFPCSAELDRVLRRALHKKVEFRYETAKEFAEDLEKLLPAVRQAEHQMPENVDQAEWQLNDATLDGLAELDLRGPNLPPDFPTERETTGNPQNLNRSVAGTAAHHGKSGAGYIPPNLGFRLALGANVRLLTKPYNRFTMLKIAVTLVGTYCVAFYLLVVAVLHSEQPTPLFGALLTLLVSFGAACLGLVKAEPWLTENPRCPGCKLPMRVSSAWSHYAKSRLEDSYMRRDCLGAIKMGAWEEAAKLFTILGRTNRWSDSLRYQLTFYECVGCAEHAARFAVHEAVIRGSEEQWEQKDQAVVAHAGAGIPRRNLVLRNIFERTVEAFRERSARKSISLKGPNVLRGKS